MLDTHTLNYLEVARASLGLSLQLARVARSDARPADTKGIRGAANDLETLLAADTEPRFSLFARPEGLEVTMQASERSFGSAAASDKLKPLADRLKRIVNDLDQPQLSVEGKQVADELSKLFLDIHNQAEGIAAEGRTSIPKSELVRAVTKDLES